MTMRSEKGSAFLDEEARKRRAQQTPTGTRKLPAYGRELMEMRRRGLVPERGFCNAHLIVVLDGWIARGRFRLVIAQDSAPEDLDFVGVAGLDILLAVDTRLSAPSRREAAIRAILRGLPASLIELDIYQPHQRRFIKTHANGIECKEFA